VIFHHNQPAEERVGEKEKIYILLRGGGERTEAFGSELSVFVICFKKKKKIALLKIGNGRKKGG